MRRSASEHELVALAALVWLAARLAVDVPLWIGLVALAAAIGIWQPKMAIVAAVLVASSLSAQAERSYEPLAGTSFTHTGRLVTDPRPLGLHSWRAEFRTDSGDRVLIRAAGPPGWKLSDASAGDKLTVFGSVKSLPAGDWYKSRHLVGAVTPSDVRVDAGPPWWQQPAEWLRDGVGDGGELLGPDRAALYTGLVIGDDRFQHISQQETFRAVGLAHLLAVSGQNVVFALAVASPLLRRIDSRTGFLATLAVLGWFAVATRLEPSVIRATITAGIAAWSMMRGSRATGVRVLSLAVVLAVMLDPFLVYSVGFSLSVLASTGILIGSELAASRLPGPAWFRMPLAITMSAQLAVAPLLIGTFGPVASVSILANMAAGWAAGLVMAWGLSGGLVAGVLPGPVGHILQLPATVAVWWIDLVATTAWRLPFPILGGVTAFAVLGLVVSHWFLKFQSLFLRLLTIAALTVLAVNAIPSNPEVKTVLEGGGTYWPATERTRSVLIVDASSDARIIGSIVSERIMKVDYLVLVKGGRTASLLTPEILRLVDASMVLAPPQHQVRDATTMTWPAEILVIEGRLRLQPEGEVIVVAHVG